MMKPGRLEIGLVAVPILIASIQLFFYKTSDLTSWRGGGFGMYSDPHPNISRNVWLTGEGDSRAVAIRLYPLDERLHEVLLRNTKLRRDLEKLERVARWSRNFPSSTNLSHLDDAWHQFMEDQSGNAAILALFPHTEAQVKVVEVAIAEDFKSVASRTISDRRLCSH